MRTASRTCGVGEGMVQCRSRLRSRRTRTAAHAPTSGLPLLSPLSFAMRTIRWEARHRETGQSVGGLVACSEPPSGTQAPCFCMPPARMYDTGDAAHHEAKLLSERRALGQQASVILRAAGHPPRRVDALSSGEKALMEGLFAAQGPGADAKSHVAPSRGPGGIPTAESMAAGWTAAAAPPRSLARGRKGGGHPGLPGSARPSKEGCKTAGEGTGLAYTCSVHS